MDGIPREWVGQLKLRARVAAAEVRDAEVRAEKVRAVLQQVERLAFEDVRPAVLPQIL